MLRFGNGADGSDCDDFSWGLGPSPDLYNVDSVGSIYFDRGYDKGHGTEDMWMSWVISTIIRALQ
jgi:hypothetical protein